MHVTPFSTAERIECFYTARSMFYLGTRNLEVREQPDVLAARCRLEF
jgi:hypothetical protein